MKVATSLVHASWIPERVETIKRLRVSLGVEIPELAIEDLPAHSFANASGVQPAKTPLGPYHEETIRGPSWVWQEDQFRWFATTDADVLFVTQDDQRTPGAKLFWSTFLAMLEGSQAKIICFHTGLPAARTLFAAGEVAYTTVDGLVGQGYAMRRDVALDFQSFRANELVADAFDCTALNTFTRSEDNLIGLFAMTRGIRIWHPIPTIIDHDLSIASTNEGYDSHLYRSSQVTWEDARRTDHPIEWNSPERWAAPPVHLGMFYDAQHGIHMYAPLMLRDRARGEELAREIAKDVCPLPYRKFFHRLQAGAGE